MEQRIEVISKDFPETSILKAEIQILKHENDYLKAKAVRLADELDDAKKIIREYRNRQMRTYKECLEKDDEISKVDYRFMKVLVGAGLVAAISVAILIITIKLIGA